MVLLANFGQAPFVVGDGDRIAQLVVSPVVQARPFAVEQLGDTKRGDGGYGHTG
jgi:dUTP pyrophosphatase